jgi:hypothetical protein
MRKNIFDTEAALWKAENPEIKDVKILRVRELGDLLTTMVSLSSEMQDRKAAHYSYFSSEYKFTIDEEAIKKLAREKGCDVVLYVSLKGVDDIKLSGNRINYKTIEFEGKNFFNSVFYCKTLQ